VLSESRDMSVILSRNVAPTSERLAFGNHRQGSDD
jgi:hypothetical protein